MLREAGLLNEEQLREALVAQKNSNLRLGQLLIQMGILNECQLADQLADQLGVKRFLSENFTVDPQLAKIIPAETAQKHRVVPLRKKGKLLTVGMTDPTDIGALDAVETQANLEVDAVLCTEPELNQFLERLYGAHSDLNDVLQDIRESASCEGPETPRTPTVEDVEVASLQQLAEDAPVVRLVNSILSQAIRENASDIHVSPEKENVQVRFRVDGKLREVPAPPKSMFLPLVSRLKVLGNMDISVSRVPQDGRFTVHLEGREVNIRVSSIPTIYGENLVLRLLDVSAGVYSLERLGMSKEDMAKIATMVKKPYGMILSTGPTGSGKTTSLYAILQELNTPDIHIMTLEDPVEYRVDRIRQVQLNRKAGMTFASGLRSILRQDPDVIMVGEIRDAETARIAVQAALTGHRVLSTVHTNDAAGAVTRLLDMEIEPFLVSSVMLVSFAQRLIRRTCPECREPYMPAKEALKAWGLENTEGMSFQRGKGCFNCMQTGFKGRTGVFEVLVIDEMVRDMILQRKSSQEITRAAQKAGKLRTLWQNAVDKVASGTTTFEEAAYAVMA